MRTLTPFNLQRWIQQHRHGPRARRDFHDAPGEETFHQLEGDVILATIQDRRRVNVPIRQGETLLLPAHVPHSPQRFAGAVGLDLPPVIDSFWGNAEHATCRSCGTVLLR